MATKTKPADPKPEAPAPPASGAPAPEALSEENAKLQDALRAAEEELAALKASVAAAPPAIVPGAPVPVDYAPLVEAKVAAGLPREQALEVVRAQIEHDARLAKAAAK